VAKILVVDDNSINRKLLVALLSHDGHLTAEASDGKEGLQVARAERPQLVISDIVMPTMDGFDFVRALRVDADLHDLPVIFYTANYHEREAQKLAEACHVARVLVKPCPPAEILKAVDQIMAGVSESGRFFMPETFDREHLLLVTNKLAEQTDALAASNSRLMALGALNLEIASIRDPQAMLQAACSGARNLVGGRYGVLMAARNTGQAAFFVTCGIDSGISLPAPALDGGPLGAVMTQRRAWRADGSAPVQAPFPADYPAAAAFLAVPLATTAHSLGWLCLADKLGADRFSEEDERLLAGFAALVAQLLENAVANDLQKVVDSRLAAIVDSSTDAIIGKTLQGRITSWNQGAEILFGYSAEEAVGQPVQMLIPHDREQEEMRILANISRGDSVPAFDTIRRAKDGRLIDVSLTISPVRDGQGRVVGAAKIVRDISMKRVAELTRRKTSELETENKQIQEASRLKSQFLANMSHELRTPLNAIIGFADLLHTGTVPLDSPKVHEYLGYIGDSGRHLLKLINDVLDLSKVESGRLDFSPAPLQLPALVKEVTDILQAELERKHLALTIDLDRHIGELQLDHSRLKQALFNYLSNAIKFTAPGGRITVRGRAEGPSQFRLEVEDSGIGIAQEDIPRLFNEFTQLDTGYDKHHPGTGLGLALTRRLIEAQGGQVGVRSVLGTGSVFHLVLDRLPGAGARGAA
jgi:PAS domain S-box-containing protein